MDPNPRWIPIFRSQELELELESQDRNTPSPDDVRGKLGGEIIPSEVYIIDRARYRTSLFASDGRGKVPQDCTASLTLA